MSRKIYNEVIIDMNPESPTFEEILYEDSFEHSGDIMLMQDTEEQYKELWVEAGIGYNEETGQKRYWYYRYTWDGSGWVKDTSGTHDDKFLENRPKPIGGNVFEWGAEPDVNPDFYPIGKHEPGGTYGAPSIGYDAFFNADGTQKDPRDVAEALWEAGAGRGKGEDGGNWTEQELYNQVIKFFPQLESVSKQQEGFIAEMYGAPPTTSPSTGVDAKYDYNNDGQITMDDVELAPSNIQGGLASAIASGREWDVTAGETTEGVTWEESIAGRKAGITFDTAGITYGAAKGVYDFGISAAERDKELAYETFGLGKKEAIRGKETMLSELQEGAFDVGSLDRSTYGGMGIGERSELLAQRKLEKGLETGYDIHGDVIAGLTGTRERTLGEVSDEEKRLSGEYERAGKTYDLAEDTYDLAGDISDYDYRYDMWKAETGEYDIFENYVERMFFKKGGRVPSKGSFSSFLQSIPDAGGG